MSAGRLRHSVTFQSPERVRNSDTGGWDTVWANVWLDPETELVDVPAEVLTGPGREVFAAGSKRAEYAARINLRWFPGLNPQWRVLWDGDIYNIESVDKDRTGRRWYRLGCTAGINDGS